MNDNVKKSFAHLEGAICARAAHPSDGPYLNPVNSTHGVIGIDGRVNAAQLRLIAQWLDDQTDTKAMLLLRPDGDSEPVPLASVQIPDVYNLSFDLADAGKPIASHNVLEIWHLAHDMLKQLQRDAGIGS